MPKPSDAKAHRLEAENAELRATITTLKDMIASLQVQLKEAMEGNTELRALLIDMQGKLDKLLEQRKKRDRKDYGPTTERNNPRPAPSSPTADNHRPKAPPKPRNHAKHIHSQNLDTEPVEHKVRDSERVCPTCIVETEFVKNELSYQLEKTLATIKRLEHQQEVRSCPKCRKYVVTAEKPCPPILGGLPGPCLLSSTIVEKCDDGLPQYRQSKRFERDNATIPRSTLCDWFQAGSLTLEPLYERLKHQLRSSAVIQTDDSPVKIQNRKAKGSMRKGKMTVYRGDADHPAIVFDFSPDLSFTRNKAFFQDFAGFVQADAAGGFDALFEDGTKIEVGCGAHSRRRYFELCDDIIALYGKLYKIEDRIKGKPAAYRLAIRRRQSKPLTRQLRRRLHELKGSLHPTHPLMDAVAYTLKHWIALHRFLGNPNLEIDNNAAERAIKTFVLMRKNSLFVGSDAGGKALAINLSLVLSCKRNGVNPVAYLTDVFTRINTMKTSELDQLLPDRWAKEHKQKSRSSSRTA